MVNSEDYEQTFRPAHRIIVQKESFNQDRSKVTRVELKHLNKNDDEVEAKMMKKAKN